jgi:hypothetical protein
MMILKKKKLICTKKQTFYKNIQTHHIINFIIIIIHKEFTLKKKGKNFMKQVKF